MCEADYMAATNLNNTGVDDSQPPINLMREDPDQYYLSCDEDDRDYTHSSNGKNNFEVFA